MALNISKCNYLTSLHFKKVKFVANPCSRWRCITDSL